MHKLQIYSTITFVKYQIFQIFKKNYESIIKWKGDHMLIITIQNGYIIAIKGVDIVDLTISHNIISDFIDVILA